MKVPPLRFIHTADWQIGLRAHFVPGDAGAIVRDARLRTVRRIGALAREIGAELCLVAGDVLESHQLKPDTLRKLLDALADQPVAWYLLPGNHDPLTPESVYRLCLWRRHCPPNVHVLGATTPVEVRPGAHLLPCPLFEREMLDDPTAHLQSDFGPTGGYRIGVAHGGIEELLPRRAGEDREVSNPVPLDLAARARLDYLALGDWHGKRRIDARTWYSGAPEPTRFKEVDPGYVLQVDLAEPGAEPVVTPHRVTTHTWLKHREALHGPDDLARLRAWFEGLPDKADTLLELHLEGTLECSVRAELDGAVLADLRQRLCWLRVRDEGLHSFVDEDDLASIARDGWVREVIDELRASERPEDRDALRLLYRLHREATS